MDKQTVEKIKLAAQAHLVDARAIADYMGDHPEVGLDNHLAADRITKYLSGRGYQIEKDYKGVTSAFRAYQGNSEKPAAALLVETDALPELGHACGHSLSAAASVLAADIVSDVFGDSLDFRVELIGTPGEELPSGKVYLTERHAFDGYKFAMMTHMGNATTPCAKFLACADKFITFHGRGTHASASPENGINALNAARLYMDAMDMRRQHLPSTDQIHGIVVNGGISPGVVPEEVSIFYYFRGLTTKDVYDMLRISDETMQGAAMMTGTTCEAEHRSEVLEDLYRNPVASKIMIASFEALGIDYEVNENCDGSSDIGNVDQVIPCFHAYSAITDKNISLHTPEFEALTHTAQGTRGMVNAAESMAYAIGMMGQDASLVEELTRVHHEYRGL